MDGPVGVSQCPIPAGSTFVYDFNITQPGTYWYHSHDNGQYPDGLRGPLIIHDPESPYKGQYDEEIVLTLSDWYHDQMQTLIPQFISVTNPTGAEPVPDAALFNDTQNLQVMVEPGKTYMIRMVNMAAFAAQYVWFEGHTMRIVEVDGIYTDPAEADMIYITAGQRYSVLITTKNDTSTNFAFVGSMDQDLFDTVSDTLKPNVTGWLVYDLTKKLPVPMLVDEFVPFDDFALVPTDREEIFDNVDYSFELEVVMDNLNDGANYAFFNNITYVRPKVPSLYTALSAGDLSSNSYIYGSNTNAFVLKKDDVVEIVVNNNDPGKHPFHLHGHSFQAVARSDENAGYYAYNTSLSQIPMRRDTFMVRPQGYIVLRFRADNPDMSLPSLFINPVFSPPSYLTSKADMSFFSPRVWLFHCHIEWHVDSGLIATMIEAPEILQQTTTIPPSHLAACQAQGIPTVGNAAANTDDFFDLRGENMPPPPIPAGFTVRGIIALVFSCLSAFLGIAVISWYGLGEVGKEGSAQAINVVAKAGVVDIDRIVSMPEKVVPNERAQDI
ncbi:hypothetical protein MMC25_008231 [Agyrium rufum]|nr:hypothetical protein [Agyrium rufum]